MRAPWITVALPVMLGGCARQHGDVPVHVTDSAGVRIVTNASVTATEWAVTPEPLLDLGTTEGGGPEQFFQVTGARRLADGRLIVVNGGSQEVRIFGPDGAFVRSLGRAGQGPGEFGFPGQPWVINGDSLAFWDYRLRRIAIFDSAGSFGRFLLVPQAVMNPALVGVLPDARAIVASHVFDMAGGATFKMMHMDFFLLGPTGEIEDTLPRQPLAEYGQVAGGGRSFVANPIFELQTRVIGDAQGYWVGTGRREEVLRYSPTGKLVMEVRWPARDRSISPADVEAEIQRRIDGVPEAQVPAIKKLHESIPVAEQFPAYNLLQTDALGDLWVQDYERPGHTGGSTWRVFDPQGILIGVVQVPGEDQILDAGEDYVVAVHPDEVDVEHVRVYGLSRGGGG